MAKGKKRTPLDHAISLAPGIYEIYEAYPCPYHPRGYWLPDTKFIVEKHVEKIGCQKECEYFSVRLLNSERYLIKSYRIEEWNKFIVRLVPVDNNFD